MSRWVLLFVILIPVAEVWGIVAMSHWIGGWSTFGLILLTGFAGAWLARSEGRKVWIEAQRQLASGEMPGRAVLDGLCVLGGGLLLVLPGFITDIVGLTMLFPLTRPFYRLLLYGWLERKARSGSLRIRRGPYGH